MKIEELNPFIRYARMHQNFYPQKENSVCYDCRLFFVLKGEGVFLANGKTQRVSSGFTAFLPPKTRYKFAFTNSNAVKIYVLNFDLTDEFYFLSKSLGTATESNFLLDNVPKYDLPEEFNRVIIRSNGVLIQGYVGECVNLFLRKTAYYKYSASALLKLVLIDLLKSERDERKEYKLVEKVQDFIRNHYQDCELTNQTIAKEFNYHPYHINRVMKEQTRITLRDYLINYRLDMAKNCLVTTALTITEIAEKTGFSSYTYFIKLFRERVGDSPLKYRKAHKNIGF